MDFTTVGFLLAGVMALVVAGAALIGRYSDRPPDARLAALWGFVGTGFLVAAAL